jgi:hypothetical protein
MSSSTTRCSTRRRAPAVHANEGEVLQLFRDRYAKDVEVYER